MAESDIHLLKHSRHYSKDRKLSQLATQTNKHAEWRKAMNEEFDALLKNGTWFLVSPPP
jgi:hypothetical protein